VINTTLGVGGIFDVATDLGYPPHREDFGQTLAVWGLPPGPYLFVPALGPGNPRDVTGFAVDVFLLDPFGTVVTGGIGQGDVVEGLQTTRTVLGVLSTREQLIETLDEVNRTSLDRYATIRSAYRQRRAAEIDNRDAGAANSRRQPRTGATR
jgi:phospholipid-binding lipoprotein MlaA